MKTYSEILQLPIMEILEGKEYAKSKDIIMNLDTKEIALVLEGSILGNLNVIKSEDLEGIGEDFVIIMTSKAIQNTQNNRELLDILSKYYSIYGVNAVTTDGNVQGKIRDFTVDGNTKQVVSIELENGDQYDAGQIISISEKFLFLQATEEKAVTESTSEESESPSLEKEQDETAYLIGKIASEDVMDQGSIFVGKGTTLTREIISEAQEKDLLAELILSVE